MRYEWWLQGGGWGADGAEDIALYIRRGLYIQGSLFGDLAYSVSFLVSFYARNLFAALVTCLRCAKNQPMLKPEGKAQRDDKKYDLFAQAY